MWRKRVDRVYTMVLGKMIMVAGIVMVCSIAIQILTRYIPGFSITWTDELARFSFVWYGFLGAGLAVTKGAHLGIDYFYQKTKGILRRVFDIIVALSMLSFSCITFYSGMKLLKVVSRQMSSVMGISLKYFYGTVPVCALLILIYSIALVMDLLHGESLYVKEDDTV